MNDGEIAAIRARLHAATPGPWEIRDIGESEPYIYAGHAVVASTSFMDDGTYSQGYKDAQFIAHAPADIAYLLDEVAHLQTDVHDLAFIASGHEDTIVRLMDMFDCPNPNAVVEHIQARFEMLQNDLRIARAEATSARPGPCVPERDETMFVEDAAPPRE
jgi:hypothetical protein